ncbi:MAG TPA: hypothetical protein VK735_39570 [Pseudonocardia sp.]|uniref:hypothetical protein n=1 Tax=Pseudonocardia sp. TaxID=60912 RepID=UPI002BE45FFB|nr:hypothetical protein [Pseudonocardia sp.]HTF53582.1 hypothetical protein [Pseudonocardia sp.]
MPWKPQYEGDFPSLGYYLIDWMIENLAAPARYEYEPFVPYKEQEDFLINFYRIDPTTGRFVHDRGLLGRPRGWGKSPFLGALAIAEGLADVLFDGWDASGQPVGRPWRLTFTPLIHIAAVSEEQTKNTWQPLQEMIREGPVIDNYPGLEPMDTFINLPGRGSKIVQVTSSARTIKGAPTNFAVLDQTEEWVPSNGGPDLSQNIRTNCSKNGGRTVESPNAYIPGELSVAEKSAETQQLILEGRARNEDLLYDHREAPANTDMSDRESLIIGLRHSYGDSSGHPDGCVIHTPPCPPGHVDLEAQISRIWDPAMDTQKSRSDYLNQITHASDSWVSKIEWDARHKDIALDVLGNPITVDPIMPGDVITMGFDGSRGRERGKADATALIGVRVHDGHWFEIGVWEQPKLAKNWSPPVSLIEATVDEAFRTYKVVGFFADPSGWTGQVATWEARYGKRLRVKASQERPIAAWPRGRDVRMVEWVKRAHDAIVNGEMTHSGQPSLSEHVLNARKRAVPQGYLLYKAYPDSPQKIDAAYAGVLAWKARLDAVTKGIGRAREPKKPKVLVMAD